MKEPVPYVYVPSPTYQSLYQAMLALAEAAVRVAYTTPGDPVRNRLRQRAAFLSRYQATFALVVYELAFDCKEKETPLSTANRRVYQALRDLVHDLCQPIVTSQERR